MFKITFILPTSLYPPQQGPCVSLNVPYALGGGPAQGDVQLRPQLRHDQHLWTAQHRRAGAR